MGPLFKCRATVAGGGTVVTEVTYNKYNASLKPIDVYLSLFIDEILTSIFRMASLFETNFDLKNKTQVRCKEKGNETINLSKRSHEIGSS